MRISNLIGTVNVEWIEFIL